MIFSQKISSEPKKYRSHPFFLFNSLSLVGIHRDSSTMKNPLGSYREAFDWALSFASGNISDRWVCGEKDPGKCTLTAVNAERTKSAVKKRRKFKEYSLGSLLYSRHGSTKKRALYHRYVLTSTRAFDLSWESRWSAPLVYIPLGKVWRGIQNPPVIAHSFFIPRFINSARLCHVEGILKMPTRE